MSTKSTTKPQKAVIAAITKNNGPMTDAELAEALGGSPSSKYKSAIALVEKGILIQHNGGFALSGYEAAAPAVAEANGTEAPEADEPVESPDHNHEEVAAAMAAEVESKGGTPIRVAAPILPVIAAVVTDEAPEDEVALAARIAAADVRKDGSVKIAMTKDERNTLLGLAESFVASDEVKGSAKSASRALVKWLQREDIAAAA